MSDLPAWVLTLAQKCRVAFGLDAWPIAVVQEDCIDGDDGLYGLTVTSYRNLSARVRLRRDLDPDDLSGTGGPVTVVHEFLHIAQWPQYAAIETIFMLLSKRDRRVAFEIWRDANEQYVELLARSLTPLLHAMDRVPTDTETTDVA